MCAWFSVGVKGGEKARKLVRVELALVLRQREHLVPGVFDRAGLVRGDVPRFRGDRALVVAQQHRGGHRVGLRPTRQEAHVRLRRAAGGADLLRRARAVAVRAVAGQRLPVRLQQALQDRRMRPGRIIALKGNHIPSSR